MKHIRWCIVLDTTGASTGDGGVGTITTTKDTVPLSRVAFVLAALAFDRVTVHLDGRFHPWSALQRTQLHGDCPSNAEVVIQR